MSLTISERVENGAKLLDSRNPEWFYEVNTYSIDIESLHKCILGQVYGDWGWGCHQLMIGGDRSAQEENGFELTFDEYRSERTSVIVEMFADEWRSQILIRLAKNEF